MGKKIYSKVKKKERKNNYIEICNDNIVLCANEASIGIDEYQKEIIPINSICDFGRSSLLLGHSVRNSKKEIHHITNIYGSTIYSSPVTKEQFFEYVFVLENGRIIPFDTDFYSRKDVAYIREFIYHFKNESIKRIVSNRGENFLLMTIIVGILFFLFCMLFLDNMFLMLIIFILVLFIEIWNISSTFDAFTNDYVEIESRFVSISSIKGAHCKYDHFSVRVDLNKVKQFGKSIELKERVIVHPTCKSKFYKREMRKAEKYEYVFIFKNNDYQAIYLGDYSKKAIKTITEYVLNYIQCNDMAL